MADPLHLTIATFNHGQWDALKDGRVTPDGIELEHIQVASPYRPMVRELAFDIAEVALSTFACAKSFDIPITGIPIFSNRDVTMSPIVYNVRSGIKSPADLEGKRVGLRSFTVTNNTQCRALLQYEFGIDTKKVQWVVTEDAHVAQYKEPSHVSYAPEGRKLEDMLVAGEIDVGIQLAIEPGGDIQPLLTEDEANEVGLRYFRRTGVYPIGHVMTIKDDVLAAHPEVATGHVPGLRRLEGHLPWRGGQPRPADRPRQAGHTQPGTGRRRPVPHGTGEEPAGDGGDAPDVHGATGHPGADGRGQPLRGEHAGLGVAGAGAPASCNRRRPPRGASSGAVLKLRTAGVRRGASTRSPQRPAARASRRSRG